MKWEKTHDIREAVEAELKYDPLIDPADISVMNINGGRGAQTAPCRATRNTWRAAAAAQRVTGVKNVQQPPGSRTV
jgi:hypothetical protein